MYGYVLDEVQEMFILMICNYLTCLSHQRSQNKFFMNKLEVNTHVMYYIHHILCANWPVTFDLDNYHVRVNWKSDNQF